MIPSNFIPAGPGKRLKPVDYNDGTPSREVEEQEEWDNNSEEMKKFKEGFAYRKPSIMNVRDNLNNLHELLDVISLALMVDNTELQPVKVFGAIQLHILPKIKELEQELARI